MATKAKSPAWEKRTITVRTIAGKAIKDVKADVIGTMAVHRDGKGYQITQIPSGFRFGYTWATKAIAKRIAAEFLARYPDVAATDRPQNIAKKRAKEVSQFFSNQRTEPS